MRYDFIGVQSDGGKWKKEASSGVSVSFTPSATLGLTSQAVSLKYSHIQVVQNRRDTWILLFLCGSAGDSSSANKPVWTRRELTLIGSFSRLQFMMFWLNFLLFGTVQKYFQYF